MVQTYSETFKLSQLRLDQENYRFPAPVAGQREAIMAMINDQKQKLVRLAKDIMEMKAVSPGEPIWVTKDGKNRGMYIVLEGNRRVVALKLMETPSLADGTIVEKHFHNLSKLYAKHPIRELVATVYPSRDSAQPWIRRRHMSSSSGVGLERWGTYANARAAKAHGLKTPRFYSVIELLGNDSEEWQNIYAALDARWTTVDRVLGTEAMENTLGITFDVQKGVVRFGNGDTAAGKRLLLRMLSKMASADFDFADVERVGNRETFINQFADGAVKAKGKGKRAVTPTPASVPPSRSTTPKVSSIIPLPAAVVIRSSDSTRATLAPKHGNRVFRADGARLASLYKECQGINLSKNRNAAAFLLRVFIELSSEALLIRRNVPIPKKLRDKGRTKWSDIGIPLDTKISCVADYLDPKKNGKDFQQARLAVDPSSASAAFSTPTLHGYFHNLQLLPDPAALRSAWDAWEPYLRTIHTNLRTP